MPATIDLLEDGIVSGFVIFHWLSGGWCAIVLVNIVVATVVIDPARVVRSHICKVTGRATACRSSIVVDIHPLGLAGAGCTRRDDAGHGGGWWGEGKERIRWVRKEEMGLALHAVNPAAMR